jgi:hypothetical protein
MFAHIVVFLSFIYAIAITHPLSSGHELIVERHRVRWSPLLICWMVSSVLLLIMNWLAIFRLAAITDWSIAQILAHVLAAIFLYYACSFPALRSQPGEPIDMPAYFDRTRVPILGAFLLFGAAALLVNVVDLRSQGLSTGTTIDRIYGILPNMVAEAIGLLWRTTWLQWMVALFVLLRLAYVLTLRIIAG